MTAMLARPEHAPVGIPVGWIGEPRLLLGIGSHDLTRYAEHAAVQDRSHGPIGSVDRDALLAALDAAALAGRGGAGFPLAAKIRHLRTGARPIVVVNGCEGEPGSAKDTVLLTHTPHQVLDGAALVAAAIGARRVIIAVTSSGVAATVRRALAGRPDSSAFAVREVEERFIAGEARALVSALNGGPPVPPGRRIQPTERGIGGAPTLLSNAETFAQAALAVRLGAAFAATGTPAEPGTTLLSVTGAVSRPGVVEVPIGTSLAAVAEAAGAARSQAVVVGGFHGAWVAADPQLVLSRAGLVAAEGALGAGAVMFVGEQTCGLAELARVADWLAAASARNCGPCAFGLPSLAADVRALAAGSAGPQLVARHAEMVSGRGACAHPDGAARFALSGLAVLREEIATHQAYGGCHRRDLGHLPTSRRAAFGPEVVA